MEDQANKKRKDCTFEPGDLVLLRLQPYRQQTVHRRVSQKLSKRYFGPFTVLRRIGQVAYELQLPPSSRIHQVVHVSQLRAYHGNDPVQQFSAIPCELEVSHNSEVLDKSLSNGEGNSLSNEEKKLKTLTNEERVTHPRGPSQTLSPTSLPSNIPNLEDKVSCGADSIVNGLDTGKPKRKIQKPIWTQDFVLNSYYCLLFDVVV
jgi:hypothetical protein